MGCGDPDKSGLPVLPRKDESPPSDMISPPFLARRGARGTVEGGFQHPARPVSAVGDFAAGRVGSDFRVGLVQVYGVIPVTKLGQARVHDGNRLSGG